MIHAESVTFGGSGLDRAADLRTNGSAIAALLTDPTTRILPLWRGKPAVFVDGGALAWVPPGHTVLAEAIEAPIFLGRDDEAAWFAADVDQRW